MKFCFNFPTKNINRKFLYLLIIIILCLLSFVAGFSIKAKICHQKFNYVSDIYQNRLKNASNCTNGFVNISIDDTINVFSDLKENEYDSAFDNDTLCYLKKLHDLYGACFVLYCYYENDEGTFNLSMMSDKYSDEFTQNADWLRWGFHSYNGSITYDSNNDKRAKNDYNLVINELLRITGSEKCIERVVRLNGFVGTKKAIESMRNCKLGITGLLGPDDNRNAYFLDENKSLSLRKQGILEDANILLWSTDIRIEDHIGETNLLDNSDTSVIAFSHEWKLKDPKVKLALEDLCFEAIEDGYHFDYPVFQSNNMEAVCFDCK